MRRLVRVQGESMSPTYRSSDLLLARPPGRGGMRVSRGDVAVLRHAGIAVIKRVVGEPGDVVELEAGRLRVNGSMLDGGPRPHGAFIERWRVPAGGVFVAGDNALASEDSRVWDHPFVSLTEVEAVITRRLTPRLPLPRVAAPEGSQSRAHPAWR